MQNMATFCFITVFAGSVMVQFWIVLLHCFLTSSAFLEELGRPVAKLDTRSLYISAVRAGRHVRTFEKAEPVASGTTEAAV